MREQGGSMELSAQQLERAAFALGLPIQEPREQLSSAATELRLSLDAGLPAEHPRCQALLQFINSARLHLEPKESHPAQRPDKLSRTAEEIAADIDSSNVALCNLIGVQNSKTLDGRAASILRSNPRKHSTVSPGLPVRETRSKGKNAGLGNISVTEKRAGQTKLRLLPLASRAAVKSLLDLARTDDALGRAATVHKQIAKTRHPRKRVKRKRRATDSSVQSRATPSELMPAPSFRISSPVQQRTVNLQPNGVHYPQQGAHHGGQMHYAPLQIPTAGNGRTHQILSRAGHMMHNGQGALGTNTVGPQPVASPIIRQFLNPAPMAPAVTPVVDHAWSIRAVLAERERAIYRQINQRQAELISLPMGVSEEMRRKAVIESKQMQLMELQRVVRSRLCVEMKKSWSPAYQEYGVVPSDNLSRLYRRSLPTMYSYTDGYPRIGPFDVHGPLPPRSAQQIAWDSRKMAQYDYRRMLEQKSRRAHIFSRKLAAHVQNFENYISYAQAARARMNKGILRYFLEKARAEEKRKKQEQYERLRLLRSNDEQAYLNLLETTKNERLLQLVRQTDNYLMQIGAQVEKVRDQHDPAMSVGQNVFDEELTVGSNSGLPMDAMRRRRDMYYTVTHSVVEEVVQPSIMVNGKLKPYQLEGLKWMISLYNNNLNGILADEMGLGKTIQTIALLTFLIEKKNNPGPYLIIVPLSTVGNWVRELDIWAPSLTKIIYRGNKDARRNAQYRMHQGNFNVLITTYEFIVRDQNVLSRFGWKYIIIDEGHRMKNANCKLATTLQLRYRSKNRLLLTGTPLQNNLTELWALLNFLLPSIFSSADTFETWFKKPFESTTLGDAAELEEEETWLVINRLHQVLRPFLLRRLKMDVETQLPEKSESIIRCDMSVWQRVLYRQVKSKVGLATGENGSTRSYNNLLMQCKKICNHPYLFYDEEAIHHLPTDLMIRSSGKFHLLQNLIPKLKSAGHRTLIFSQMTSALDYLEDFLTEIGIQHMRLDGSTKSDERQGMLNQFNAPDSPYFCFLLSTRAGGLGLNLQTADTVIIFDSDWNPMMDLQAQDRAHRIGQKNAVRVFRLISSGTVEVKILDQANKKLDVDAKVIQAGQFNNKSTESDQHQMLKGLLRQKNDDGDELGDVPTLEELNRIVARDEEEFQAYTAFDEEREKENPYHALLTEESELPAWVLEPEVQHKTAEEREKEILESHGRGRRKRTAIKDFDQLTEQEWMSVMEGRATAEEVFAKRSARKSAKVRKNLIFDDDDDDDSDPEQSEEEPSSEEEIRPVRRSRRGRKRRSEPERQGPSSGRRSKRRRASSSEQPSDDSLNDLTNALPANGTIGDSETASDAEIASGSTDSQPPGQSNRIRRSLRNSIRELKRHDDDPKATEQGDNRDFRKAKHVSEMANPNTDMSVPAMLRLKLRPDAVLPSPEYAVGSNTFLHLPSDVSIIDAAARNHGLPNGHTNSNHKLRMANGKIELDSGSGSEDSGENCNGTVAHQDNSAESEVASALVISPNKRSPPKRDRKKVSNIPNISYSPLQSASDFRESMDAPEPLSEVGLGTRKRKSVAFADDLLKKGKKKLENGMHQSPRPNGSGAAGLSPTKKAKLADHEGNETPDPISTSSEESIEHENTVYAVPASSVKLRLRLAPESETSC